MQNLEDTKKWIEERIQYILEGCDLNDEDNKRAYDSLKTALKCVEKEIGEKK
ncbi:MAG: hypothetical protein HFJ52_04170 [Clostridia bacterium]|jgi:hypothetical protein|nr:hypothetical protein [Clostridia bacterium]